MKPELQDKLVEIITSIQSAAGAAKDFTVAQLPDVAQSYIIYGRMWNTTLAVMLVLITVVGALAAWHFVRKEKVNELTYIVPGVASLVSFVLLLTDVGQQ